MRYKSWLAGSSALWMGLAFLAGAAQVVGGSAYAQGEAQNVQSKKSDRASNQPLAIEEVVVTAERREERLVNVPVSVSAVSGDTLSTLGISEVTELENVVPGLKVADAGPVPKVGIRGITLNDFGESNESPIAIYHNDVYIASVVAPLSEMFDVERVEVQRGPQGTLFGRNATGGLIQIITKKPGANEDGEISVQYGSYNQIIVEGAQNIPFSDSIRTRTAVDYNRDDGYQKNVLNGSRFAKTNFVGIRETVDVDLSSSVTDSFLLHYGRNNGMPSLTSFRGTKDPITHATCPPEMIVANACVTSGGNRNTDLTPGVVYSSMTDSSGAGGGTDFLETWGANNTLKYAGDSFNITAVTAYESTTTEHFLDDAPTGDSGSTFFVGYGGIRKQFSQEVRGDGEIGNATWLAGVYYFHEDMPEGFLEIPNYAALLNTTLGVNSQYKQATDAVAAFGQVDYEIMPSVTLTGGLRFSHESKKLTISDDFTNPHFVDTYNPKMNRVTWKAGAKWQIQDNLMTYASVATGFKAQAFNTASVRAGQGVPAKPESDTNYEVGLKGQTDDQRYGASISVFHTDYRQMQLVATDASTPTTTLINVPKATINGIELEGNAHPFGGLSFTGNVSWLETEVHAPGVKASSTFIDGDPLTLAPKFSAKGMARYDFDTESAGMISPWVSVSYRTKTYGKLPTILLTEIPSYTLMDAGISWLPQNDTWQVDLLVQNATNEVYFANNFYYSGFSLSKFGKQRTFAIKVSRRW